jgi:hypothetical protein
MHGYQTAQSGNDQVGDQCSSESFSIAHAKDHAAEYGIKVHLGGSMHEHHLVGRWWWTQNCDKLVPVKSLQPPSQQKMKRGWM